MPKRRFPSTLLTLTGITLCAWFLAQTTFFLWEHPLDDLSGKGATTPAAPSGPEPLTSFSAITARNLLQIQIAPPQAPTPGETTAQPRASLSAEGIDTLPVSKKGWKLLGTIVTSNGQSRAVIQADGKEHSYREGERLHDWEITLIQRRAIVLAQGATRERLVFGDELPPPTEVRPDIRKTVSKARLRQELGDIATLMRVISVSPQTVGGYQGMRVVSIQTDSYLAQLGLLQNDLLLEANGKKLTGFGDLAGLSELVDTEAFTLDVLRNGKKTIIRYDVQS